MPSAISEFNLLDIGLVLLGMVALYMGYRRGFVRQVLQLAALVGGVALAVKYHGALARAEWMRPVADGIGVDGAEIVAFAGVLLAVFAACHILVCGFYGTAKGNAIGGLDRLFGGAFGIAKAAFLAGVLMLAILQGSPGDSIARLVQESVLGSRIVQGAREVVRAIPEAAKAPIREFFTGAPRGTRDRPDAGRDRTMRRSAAPEFAPAPPPPARRAPASERHPPPAGEESAPPDTGGTGRSETGRSTRRNRGLSPIRILPTPDADRPAPRTGIF
ncbi:MAG: CvpA family protein [Planctomycetes bacterium]|nr:CvpA family protein [Planctomycetota bacterium]